VSRPHRPGSLAKVFRQRILVDVRDTQLAYCLCGTTAVPAARSGSSRRARLIVSPIDFPAWIPVVGELDMLGPGHPGGGTFIEHARGRARRARSAINSKESVFDRDLRDTTRCAATARAGCSSGSDSRFRRGDEDYQSVSESYGI